MIKTPHICSFTWIVKYSILNILPKVSTSHVLSLRHKEREIVCFMYKRRNKIYMHILTTNALKLIQNASVNFPAWDHRLIQYCVKSFSSKNSHHNSKYVFPLEILTELLCLGLDITDIFVGIIWSGSHIKMGNQ